MGVYVMNKFEVNDEDWTKSSIESVSEHKEPIWLERGIPDPINKFEGTDQKLTNKKDEKIKEKWTNPKVKGATEQNEPTWWQGGVPDPSGRNWDGAMVNIFFISLLFAEFIIWVKVLLNWREDPESSHYSYAIILFLLLPSLALSLLALLHSLTIDRLSYLPILIFLLPPSPVILHLLVLHRNIKREEHTKLYSLTKLVTFIQSLLMSFPLLVFSLMTLIRATVGEDMVMVENIHKHFHQHNLQSIASSLSFLNLIVSTIRLNEEDTGKAVTLLVGVPFIVTNIGFRLLGFCLLFTYFDSLWILLCLGLLFCISASGVQLGSGQSPCSRMCPDLQLTQDGHDDPGVVVCLLLSLANILAPVGYTRGKHWRGGGWRLILVTWLGISLVLSLVINQCLTTNIPNIFTGLAPVDLSMIVPKTGLAVDIPNIPMGGFDLKLVLPRTQMTMLGDNPASYELITSGQQDMVLALVIPILLVLVTLPFTILRILLLGWDCRLVSRDNEGLSPGKTRSCLSVFCGLSSMMMFTILMVIIVVMYVMIIIQSTSDPLSRENS